MTQYLLFTLGTWHLCCKSTPPKKGGWFVENSSPGWCEWPLDWEGNDCWGCNWRGPEMCSKGRRKILPENELTSRFCNLPLVPCVWTLRYDMVFLLRIVRWTDLMFLFYYLQASTTCFLGNGRATHEILSKILKCYSLGESNWTTKGIWTKAPFF